MTWFNHQLYLLKLVALAAVLPVAALALLLVMGGVVGCAYPVFGAGMVAVAAVLFGSGCCRLARSVRFRPEAAGRRVSPEQTPELAAWLQACSYGWKGPQVGAVVLDGQGWGLELSATPVMGVLGWSRFHWVLGIYPLLALSVREFEALAGWEMVWWSDQQGWLNLQVKRLARYWQQFHRSGPEPARAWDARCLEFCLRPYAGWMLRLLEGFQVREMLWADYVIAEQHGSSTHARALCRLALLNPLLERRILPELLARVQAGQAVPEDLYGYLIEALQRRPEALEDTLELAQDGLLAAAPPLLRLRLQRLGALVTVPLAPERPAIQHLLAGTEVLNALQEVLKAQLRNQVEQRVLGQREGDRRFLALAASAPGPGFGPHAPPSLEYLQLAFERVDSELFWDLLVAYCGDRPREPEAMLLILRWTVRKGWLVQAQAQIEAMARHNPFLVPESHAILAAHYRERGDLAAAERAWNQARRAEDGLQGARRERGSASLDDVLEPHGCGASQLDAMVRFLRGQEDLGEAFLVRKKVAAHPDHPVLLLVVRPEGGWWDPGGRKREAIQARIARGCPFPGRATGHVLVARPELFWRYRRILTHLGGLIKPR